MAKAILFDFWGTLVENGVWSPSKQIQRILQLDMPFSEFILRMEQALMTKPFNELKEAFMAVADEFQVVLEEEQLEELIGMWNKNWMLAKPYPDVESTLQDLQNDYLLILISNTDHFSLPKVLEKFSLEKFFHQKYLSCDIGLLKTDPGFITKILDDLKLSPQEVLLVGDSIESDMKAAEQAGIKGILIDRHNRRDFPQKVQSLRQLLEL